MHATVDHDRCEGHGRCFAVAPEVFDLDDDGYAVIIGDTVAPEQQENAREAAAGCPRRAISLVD
ncbi:MAG: ferredoxin [Mycobacterium sp.]